MTADERVAHDRIALAHELVSGLRSEVGRFVVGQHKLLDRLLIALFTRGHVLVEGVPGLAKTLAVKTLAAAIEAGFKRVQFTPDLLPADITGTLIFDPAGGTFNPRFGPIFTNLLLADEINRAPAKVQSALLEAMQERQVTIGDTSYKLPEPFVVIATQNPIEHEGTYSLPEAQVDRFLMKVQVGYPKKEDEAQMLGLYLNPTEDPPPVRRALTLEQIAQISGLVSTVHVDARISGYIVELVSATRRPADYSLPGLVPQIAFGASPRATLAFAWAAKGHAFLQGRAFVIPEDIKEVAPDVLRHRLILTYEAAAEQIAPEHVIDQILRAVPVP
jgi:MoxR-like ATPase